MKNLFPFMKGFPKKIYLQITLLLILLFLLAISYLFYFNPVFRQSIIVKVNSLYGQTNIFNKQTAQLKLENNVLVIKLNIEDEEKTKDFFNKMGFSEEILNNDISLEVDSNLKELLKNILPTTLLLNFEENKMSFKNQNFPSLDSSSITNNFEFSTQSGKIKMVTSENGKLDLDIQKPEDLIKFATSSSQVLISKKLEPLFPRVAMIDRIKLVVDGKFITGEISLKSD